eukprot:477656_1
MKRTASDAVLLLQSTTDNVSLSHSAALPCELDINDNNLTDTAQVKSDCFSNADWSDSDSSCSDMLDIPITELIVQLSRNDEEIKLFEKGYKYINKICDTLQ